MISASTIPILGNLCYRCTNKSFGGSAPEPPEFSALVSKEGKEKDGAYSLSGDAAPELRDFNALIS